MLTYIKPQRISLLSHPDFNELWVHGKIAEDPSILGLGDLVVRDRERRQPAAGRLDMLLADTDLTRRYEVEIQLGKTDESHIIRSIEYWDIERKRYPQYEHCAVIVAEDITARFLNVIGLLNGHIPLIALQLAAYRFDDKVALTFTKVLDHLPRGLVEEDEAGFEPTDRSYWEAKSSREMLGLVDSVVERIREFDPKVNTKYTKFYIGIEREGKADNYVIFRPQKRVLRIEARIPQSDERDASLEAAGVDLMDYDAKWSRYRVRVTPKEWGVRCDTLLALCKDAFDHRSS
jgi:predicted transport protein